MENIGDMGKGLVKTDVENIKEKREEYIKEFIEAKTYNSNTCGFGLDSDYKCQSCEAEFHMIPVDANYCPACRSADLRLIESVKEQIEWRVYELVMENVKAKIKELHSQKFSKKAIAEELGLSISDVSSIGGIKIELPQEKIDYIRKAYLSDLSVGEIKCDLGRISEKRVEEVISDLRYEIHDLYDQGTPTEDIGKKIGILGHDQKIAEIIERFVKQKMYLEELESKPFGEVS